jgi:calcineurin-like phosphoesterase family protein
MTIFITSDLHLSHKNILKYTDRHKYYTDIQDHDNQIIDTINKHVKQRNILYILGDISFNYPNQLFDNLKCQKLIIVPGNHDKWIKNHKTEIYFKNQVSIIADQIIDIKHNGATFIMSHYPLARWNKGHYGSYMLHGHCHGSYNNENSSCRRLDVGWDNFYRPITLDEIIDLKKSVATSVAHHDNEDSI